MAEAILNDRSKGRIRAESAGSRPAARVNPHAIETLREHGIEWKGHPPQSVEGLENEKWDFVITVCDRAKESCPVFPGQPVFAHWGMEDPADAVGEGAAKKAFQAAYLVLARRIDLLLALPVEKLERLPLQAKVRAIGAADQVISP